MVITFWSIYSPAPVSQSVSVERKTSSKIQAAMAAILKKLKDGHAKNANVVILSLAFFFSYCAFFTMGNIQVSRVLLGYATGAVQSPRRWLLPARRR